LPVSETSENYLFPAPALGSDSLAAAVSKRTPVARAGRSARDSGGAGGSVSRARTGDQSGEREPQHEAVALDMIAEEADPVARAGRSAQATP